MSHKENEVSESLNIVQAEKFLKVSRRTIYRLFDDGKLTGSKEHGRRRVDRAELERLKKERDNLAKTN